MNWTLDAVLEATGGTLVQRGPDPARGFTTDSRGDVAGRFFLALEGPRFDGHEFVAGAVASGASGAIIARDLDPTSPDAAWVRVPDGLRALGDLAAHGRRAHGGQVVAITGSNGKTTTKEMIASILAASGKRVAQTRGNENNLVGLPLTILRLDGNEDFVVLEMGMNRKGEIARLTEIANPDVGVLTNVGPAHLEGLGTIERVAEAKGELALGLRPDATLVVNAEDPRLVAIAARFPGRTILAGREGSVRAHRVESLGSGGQRFELEVEARRIVVELPVAGRHNVTNAVVAAAATLALGADLDAVARGLARFEPPKMRLERIELRGGVVLWNDSYNANPGSVDAAIETLAADPVAARRIAVLGEMAELGLDADAWHRRVGETCARRSVDLLVVVGARAEGIATGARAAGIAEDRVRTFATPEEAADWLSGELTSGDVVLVKGSRIARMDTVVARLGGGS